MSYSGSLLVASEEGNGNMLYSFAQIRIICEPVPIPLYLPMTNIRSNRRFAGGRDYELQRKVQATNALGNGTTYEGAVGVFGKGLTTTQRVKVSRQELLEKGMSFVEVIKQAVIGKHIIDNKYVCSVCSST